MDEDKKTIILTIAEDQFVRNGIKRTNMEEIASRLKISKKTIYKFFPTKKALLENIIESIENQLTLQIQEIVKADKNAVVKFYFLAKLIGKRLQKLSPEWLFDLRTNFPELWQKIEDFRRERIQKNFNLLLNQGKREGLIIDKPNVVILTILFSAIEGVVNPEFIQNNNLSVQKAIDLTLEILINGILTPKGRRIFKQTKKVAK